MNARPRDHDTLPDVANDPHHEGAAALAWVGMQGLTTPLQLDADPAQLRCGVATVDAWVNMPAGISRGIHMSRLYASIEQSLANEPLGLDGLRRLLQSFVETHADISQRARIGLQFDLLARRKALLSARFGWKTYPCRIDARLVDGAMKLELQCRIGYSSTCPASAALARQLVERDFGEHFGNQDVSVPAARQWLASGAGMGATPHAQRSEARVRVQLNPEGELPFMTLVDQVEAALGTPLQTAVKRQDEQAFARLNGRNLMFCEDAARRIHASLDADPRYLDFAIRCSHFESLHPHDAVAIAVKGVENGFVE